MKYQLCHKQKHLLIGSVYAVDALLNLLAIGIESVLNVNSLLNLGNMV